ncbi:hypothetical protein BDQ12DRAFT_701383 [Crucibulum laeve]|uniref:Uncharacterized protein n=1 Tax=Crucibulum laeve TaxID=68775 RepID=A0A5C3LIB2_9AGAR|nr:hypothetical protein BDQ12DRAFT_701383 [Crucibulum laeve]
MPWEISTTQNVQAHDEEIILNEPKDHYFGPSQLYCVETICAPCGVVIAWDLFDKSESSTQILDFLQTVYPTEESRPTYICINKACLVLQSAISNKSWEEWKKTTRFIVDTYHYMNHQVSDAMCQKWCNPAPLNGSAPNLYGKPYYKWAFKTQACEQLNAWLGGFESILKQMAHNNFKVRMKRRIRRE